MKTGNNQKSQFRWYRLDELPDLSLQKYKVFAGNGNPLPFFKVLLNSLHRLCSEHNLRIHLLYGYDPERPDGHRFSVYLGLSGAIENISVVPIDRMLKSSLLAPYFALQAPGPAAGMTHGVSLDTESEITALASKMRFGGRLLKRETFLKASEELSELPELYRITRGFHFVASWASAEGCRLVTLANLMRSLSVASLYCLTLEPVDKTEEVRGLYEEEGEGPLYFLKRTRNQFAHDPTVAGRGGYSAGSVTDDTIDTAKKNYKTAISTLETNQHFLAAIEFWSDAAFRETPHLMAEAAASEALRESAHMYFPLESSMFSSPLPEVGRPLSTPCDPRTSRELAFLPSLLTIKEIEPFFRFPALEEGEWIGLRKETDPKPASADLSRKLKLGTLRFREDEAPIHFPLDGFAKHSLIVGVPGSGKTNTLMYIVTSLWKEHKIPFLILETAKKEHRGLMHLMPAHLRLFTPGNPAPDLGGYQFGVNLFAAPKDFPVAEHIANLSMAFKGAFPLEGSLLMIMQRGIVAVYEKHGIDPKGLMPEEPVLPTIQELVAEMLATTESYAPELRSNMQTIIRMRFESLTLGFLGDVFNSPAPTMSSEQLLTTPVVMEMESLGRDYANLFALVLCTQLREQLAIAPPAGRLRHLLVIEEAHNLIGPTQYHASDLSSDPRAAATEYIIKLLAEVRALGQGIVIADQIPSALAPEVVKNTNLKICHRLVDKNERDFMGGALLAGEERMEVVAAQLPGEALMLFEGLLKPFYVNIENIGKAEGWKAVPPDNKFLASFESAEKRTARADCELLRGKFSDARLQLYKKLCGLFPAAAAMSPFYPLRLTSLTLTKTDKGNIIAHIDRYKDTLSGIKRLCHLTAPQGASLLLRRLKDELDAEIKAAHKTQKDIEGAIILAGPEAPPQQERGATADPATSLERLYAGLGRLLKEELNWLNKKSGIRDP